MLPGLIYFPKTAHLLPTRFPSRISRDRLTSHPECCRERIIFHGLSPSALVLFPECFRDTKTCLTGRQAHLSVGRESAAFCLPNAFGTPRGKRLALRCFAVRYGASWRWDLSYRLPDDGTFILHVTAWSYREHSNHIYGNMKAPSRAELLRFIDRFSILSLPGAQNFFDFLPTGW